MTDINAAHSFEALADAAGTDGKTAKKRARLTLPAAKTAGKRVLGRTYTDAERVALMDAVGARVKDTGCTFKQAIEQSGISEQTFYKWKKLPSPASVPTETQPAVLRPAANDSQEPTGAAQSLATYSELVELHLENQRLRQLLTDKLLTENAELRRRIAAA